MAQPASRSTKAANAAMLDLLNFGDRQDFEDATHGFVAGLGGIIDGTDGEAVWDFSDTDFVEGNCPDSVNPSLWRQAQLTRISGLFTIHPRIHQIRGFDLASMTLIAGDSGWIVIDTLLSVETSRAGLALANKHLGERPVAAVIFTHSHADHFGGVRGVVDEADVASGKVPLIAPDGFMDYAISENVLAGNAMSRRAQYQFGTPLKSDGAGHVSCGLGHRLSSGTMSFLRPNDYVSVTGETRVLDGVTFEFQMANGSEAPAEFMFYLPEFRALCTSEVTSHHMHNVLTPRGAEVRDTLSWSKYINEAITLFADRTDLLFACHHWPTFGKDAIRGFLERQSDMYRFVHDETLRLANLGHTMHEIADLVEMPDTLAHDFACRGYYGTLKHNVKAVYQYYLGWWDGNPSTYDALPPVDSAKRLIKAMGAEAALAEGKRAADEGDYRWAAEFLNKLVFADPENAAARSALADVLEQMGYQAEAGTWRGVFLTGAQELRDGVQTDGVVDTATPDIVSNMGVPMLLDLLGVKFNAAKANGLSVSIEFLFPQVPSVHTLELRNGVLTNFPQRRLPHPDVSLILTEDAFFRLLGKRSTAEDLVADGCLTVKGASGRMLKLFEALDDFEPNFPIVTP